VCSARQVESWAFALDGPGLELLTSAGVFNLRTCKLCDDGIVARAQGLGHLLLVTALHPTSWATRHRTRAMLSPSACCLCSARALCFWEAGLNEAGHKAQHDGSMH
jgi:hypothetical protein